MPIAPELINCLYSNICINVYMLQHRKFSKSHSVNKYLVIVRKNVNIRHTRTSFCPNKPLLSQHFITCNIQSMQCTL